MAGLPGPGRLATRVSEVPVVPLPDFDDAYETQRVLEASLMAAREKRAVLMDEGT